MLGLVSCLLSMVSAAIASYQLVKQMPISNGNGVASKPAKKTLLIQKIESAANIATFTTELITSRAAERGGGNWGILPWAPLCLWAPKVQYTLIEQSNTLLKQSLHIFCPGPLKLSRLP